MTVSPTASVTPPGSLATTAANAVPGVVQGANHRSSFSHSAPTCAAWMGYQSMAQSSRVPAVSCLWLCAATVAGWDVHRQGIEQ